MQEDYLSIRDDENAGTGKCPWRHFDCITVACILALAVLLGILNNLRVVDERKVKWFDAPAHQDDLEATEVVEP